MAEVEIHTGHHGHETDAVATTIGLLVAVIGILLATVTIESHRAHTAAIVYKTEANDKWAYYQAKKIREHTNDVAVSLLNALSSDAARSAAAADKLSTESARYSNDAEDIQKDAVSKDKDAELAEQQALRFDLGEGFLELGLVLTSLYFLARRKLLPILGISAAIIGTAVGASGFFVG